MPSGVPKSETICLIRTTTNGDVYCITTKGKAEGYFLYKLTNAKAERIAKGNTPPELENKYIKE